MTDHNPSDAVALDQVDCVSYRLRRAARTASRFFDDALRPSGLRNTQFTLLGSLEILGEVSIGDLSRELAIDDTTLTRNLDVLVRRGHVENIDADDGRMRKVRLTGLGKETLEKALPYWRMAQRQALEALTPEHWIEMRSNLKRIEAALGNPK